MAILFFAISKFGDTARHLMAEQKTISATFEPSTE